MSACFDLACMGRAAVDLYGEQIGCALEDVSTFARYLGGSPANTAVGAARLGLRAAMISRVGDEQNGRFVLETLRREGVDVSQVRVDPERLTALVFLAMRGRDDFPHIFYRDNCADMAIAAADLDTGFLARCGCLLISGTHLSRESTFAACLEAVRLAKAAGARIALDIDYRPVLWGLAGHSQGDERFAASELATRRLLEIATHCDLVVGTAEEFRIAGGQRYVTAAVRAVRAATDALLVVKLGPLGCIAYDDDVIPDSDTARVDGFRIEPFNVLGAGDAFMAGFLRGWLRGEKLRQCCTYANACGAIVVSRHGCAPAMPTMAELRRFLDHGAATPRLREDVELEHLHRATTRHPVSQPLLLLAFDHRAQLEALADSSGAQRYLIANFKSLVADAFLRVARGRPGSGVILDDRYGADNLPRLTQAGAWIARPVEAPGSTPVAFEAGINVGLQLRAWPARHVAKCLVFFHPDDPESLREAQIAQARALAQACAATGRELLLEIIAAADRPAGAFDTARSMEAFYRAGVRPDWWKLPPGTDARAWQRIGEAIERFDPLCRGVLVLGMEAGPEQLRESFAAAARSPWVRGFAVGRSIFAAAAEEWFALRCGDAEVVDQVAARYAEVIALWEEATAHCALQPEKHEENA